MTYSEEIEYAKKLLKAAFTSIGEELEDEDMETEDGREAVFVAHAIMKIAMQAQREACAEAGGWHLARASWKYVDFGVGANDIEEMKQAILNAEVRQ